MTEQEIEAVRPYLVRAMSAKVGRMFPGKTGTKFAEELAEAAMGALRLAAAHAALQ